MNSSGISHSVDSTPTHVSHAFFAVSIDKSIDLEPVITTMKQDLKSLEAAVTKQGEIVKALKAQKLSKSEIQPAVDELIKLKADLNALLATEDGKGRFDRSVLESILLKRFFFAPSFQIYGGIAGLFDYGPPGCALQTNILSMWRQHFVLEEDMLEVECTNLTPEVVFKTSGHVERFADFMVKDLGTGDIFRADHLIKQVLTQRLEDDRVLRLGASAAAAKRVKPKGSVLEPEVREKYEKVLETLDNYIGDALGELIKTFDIRSPETNNELSKPTQFNMMFDTQIGPTGQFKGYLRPETAQGHFVNFKRLLEYNNQQMPFASASIGKSFRNEISPRQFILRVREFTMAEIEHFVHPERKQHPRFHEVRHVVLPLYSSDAQMAAQGPTPIAIGDAVEKGIVNNETLGYFITRIYLFLLRVGVDPKRIRLRQHLTNELAHYACDCWDADIESSYGWIECVGCADRSAYDLTVHAKKTGEKLIAQDTLPEPIIRDALVLKIVQSKIGPAFKKDAKAVLGYLESLKINEDEWDEKSLADIEKKLKEGDGKVDIVGTDGKTYTLTSEMISVSQTTLKISGKMSINNIHSPYFFSWNVFFQNVSSVEQSILLRSLFMV